jgi:hypothetical protein
VRSRGRCDGVNTAPGFLTSRVGHDPFIVMVHGICHDTGSKGMLWVAAQRRIGSEERMRWVFGHEGAT